MTANLTLRGLNINQHLLPLSFLTIFILRGYNLKEIFDYYNLIVLPYIIMNKILKTLIVNNSSQYVCIMC